MKWLQRWLQPMVNNAVDRKVEFLREYAAYMNLSARLMRLDGRIATAETRVRENIDKAIERVDVLCSNEMGRIVFQTVQMQEREVSIKIRSDIEDLQKRCNRLKEIIEEKKP